MNEGQLVRASLVGTAVLMFLSLSVPLMSIGMSYDEPFNMMTFHQTFIGWVKYWWTQLHIHPPLVSVGYFVWNLIAGDSEAALRIPTVFAGILVLLTTYRTGRRLFNEPTAIAGTFILAASAGFLRYSVSAVHAIFEALVVMVSVLCFLRYCERPDRKRLMILLLCNLAGFATFYYYVFLAAFQGLYLLIYREKFKVPVFFFVGLCATAALCGYFILSGHHQTYRYHWWGRGSLAFTAEILGLMLFGSNTGVLDTHLPTLVPAVLLGAFVVGLVLTAFRNVSQEKRYLALAMFLPPFAVFVIGGALDVPIGRDRTFFYLTPLYALVISYLLSRIIWQKWVLGLVVAMSMVALIYEGDRTFENFYLTDYPRQLLAQVPDEGEGILIYHPSDDFVWKAYFKKLNLTRTRFVQVKEDVMDAEFASHIRSVYPRHLVGLAKLDVSRLLEEHRINMRVKEVATVNIEIPKWFNYAKQSVPVHIYTLESTGFLGTL